MHTSKVCNCKLTQNFDANTGVDGSSALTCQRGECCPPTICTPPTQRSRGPAIDNKCWTCALVASIGVNGLRRPITSIPCQATKFITSTVVFSGGLLI